MRRTSGRRTGGRRLARRASRLAICGVLACAAVAGAARAERPRGTFSVTNDARRVVECNLLVDGRTRTYLKVHVGKTYSDSFTEGRRLQLACVHGRDGMYAPLQLGVDYRFVERDGWIAVVPASAE